MNSPSLNILSYKSIFFLFVGFLFFSLSLCRQEQNQILPFHFYGATDAIALSKDFARPVLPDSVLSADRHFKIHYTTNGKDSVAIDDANANFVPDRIEKIAQAFEISFRVECQQMSYMLPPSMKNETAPYDVYVIDLVNQYAVTVKENFDTTASTLKNVFSFILFDNDFIGHGFHIQGDQAINVTAAHEFFHAVQLGYAFRNTDSFFFELSAVWMEDKVFDEVDNYLYYLDYFFAAPEIPLNGVSFTIPNVFKHIYGSSIFGFYIEENFGAPAILQIWQLMPDMPALEAMDRVFKNRGSNFENEFVKFCLWNYFTGERAVKNFSYHESAKYPEIRLNANQSIEFYFEGIGNGYFLTAAYFQLQVAQDGIYQVHFTAEISNHWRLGIISWNQDQIKTYLVRAGETVKLDPVAKGQILVAMPCNIDRFANPTLIYFKEHPEEYNFIFTKEKKVNTGIAKSFQIESIYPNPFSEALLFSLKKISTSNITVKVFNCIGQMVDLIVMGELTQELNQLHWSVSASNEKQQSGLYFFQFSDGNFVETKKAILFR